MFLIFGANASAAFYQKCGYEKKECEMVGFSVNASSGIHQLIRPTGEVYAYVRSFPKAIERSMIRVADCIDNTSHAGQMLDMSLWQYKIQ